MDDEKKERSFLAMLDLADGTKLSFSRIVSGGAKVEEHDYLCANSLASRSIIVYFRAGGGSEYVVLFKGIAPDLTLRDQSPLKVTDPTQPADQESPIYIGVNAGGWVNKTTNAGIAYLAQISGYNNIAFSIDRTDAQEIYLKSSRSKKFMQTYKREDFPGKAWFAWMTDCDGTDAVLKLTIIERYNADGSVKR
ncbi:hypothetical protein ALQ33_02844 [Pseudomonas syringae pv. philadelphi]|uniref:Uncharacterized protein n=1 Tax=Pseudomonas syringae pv. philadelphi TaxID=251706 RepID=A0A3M3YB90_9PSED|nr:hypothetical protein [Pseudomonas syringae group genomosp. 3]RMO79439.1 hypothetical protein ALQ33_02844 [Pseudomonas syringae pv. philadelphi]